MSPVPTHPLGTTPLQGIRLTRGTYMVIVEAPGRYPVLLGRREPLRTVFELPPAGDVPEGFVYVPPGAVNQRSRFSNNSLLVDVDVCV
ncbi:Hypothetical protein A7982_06464 [Minicystis rosea]|nr:Hypothetical protein A7982_06464 [Minicystis rosea]